MSALDALTEFGSRCALELTPTQTAAWTAASKATWIGPLTHDEVVQLYCAVKNMTLQHIHAGATNLHSRINTLTWNGSFWAPPAGPSIEINFATNVPTLLSQSALNPPLIIEPEPIHIPCRTFRDFRQATLPVLTPDGDFWLGGLVTIFGTFPILGTSPQVSAGIVFDPVADSYYVPLSVLAVVNLNQDVYPPTSSGLPPPPQRYQYTTVTTYNWTFKTNVTVAQGIECTVAVFGHAPITLELDAGSPVETEETFALVIDGAASNLFT